ncbi:MAG: HAMP domain-containing protein [Thioploca sp.]|nr:HAMP domain-containing protein [Thioploca sp.]
MKLVADLQIKYKLALMLLLPLLGLLFFAVNVVTEKAGIAHEMSQLEKLIQLSLKLSTVVHQIQHERNVSELFLKTQGNQYFNELDQALTSTDQVIKELNQFISTLDTSHYPIDFTTRWQQLQQIISTLKTIRAQVSSQQNNENQTVTVYSNVNNKIINFISYISNIYQHKNFDRLKLAYFNWVMAKEKSALEGNLLSRVFKQRYFELGEFRQFVELVSQQQAYLEAIQQDMSGEQQAFFEKKLANRFITEINHMREIAYEASIDGIIKTDLIDTEGVMRKSISEYWFNMHTGKMALFKEIENHLARDLMTRSYQARQQAQTEYLLILIVTSMIIIFTLLLGYFILTGIINRLKQAVSVASAISAGYLDTIIRIESKDETGQLLREIASMQTQLRNRLEADKQMTNHLHQQMEENQRIANEALRINKALDNVTTPVVIMDNDHHIIYLNRMAGKLLEKENLQWVTNLSEFKLKEWTDNQEDTQEERDFQCQLLFQLTDSYSSRFKMGNLIIDSTITPVINEQGEHLGTVAEFPDITVQVGLEQEINTVIQAVSQGNFQQRIKLDNKIGFFQVFSQGINQIIDLNQVVINDILDMFSALAKGYLTQTIANRSYTGSFAQLKEDANTTVQKLLETISVIKKAAEAIDKAAEAISQDNYNLNQRTEQQAAALEQTAASMEQLTSTVQQNADNTRQANQLATNAKERAIQGGELVNNAITAMIAINQSSQKVANIINVIDEIAFQTNLLALNAAVEAARAGDKGHGFAVVATEVRNLAQRSATAAKEIKELIRESVTKIAQGTQLVNQSGQTLEELVSAVKTVSEHIAEIAIATREQSGGINQINKAIIQMDEMTQQNATLVGRSAVTSQALAEQAQQLIQQVAFFKLNMEIS